MQGMSTIGWLAALVLVMPLAGCNDSGGGAAPAGLNMSGDRSGEYSSPVQAVSVNAKITQDGDALVIETTKAGNGHLLTGRIDADGKIWVMDAGTGQTWTTTGTTAANVLTLQDYYYDPAVSDLMQTLSLRR